MIYLYRVVDRKEKNSTKIVIERVDGNEIYRFAETGENLDDKITVNAIKMRLGIKELFYQNSRYAYSASVSNGPTFAVDSIIFFYEEENLMKMINGECIRFGGDHTIVLFRPIKTLFTQNPKYCRLNEKENLCLCFKIDPSYIDSCSKVLKRSPVYSNLLCEIADFDKLITVPVRIVLHQETFDELVSIFTEEIKAKYGFERFSVRGTEEKYWISSEVSNFKEKIVSDDFELKNRVISIIAMNIQRSMIKNDFSKNFVGWDFTVFPFVNFIQGLSVLNGSLVGRKCVHLFQSFGYGKTRLCFEVLRYFGRGIYCVHREGKTGYPQNTELFSKLFTKFESSLSEETTMAECRGFIEAAITNFSDFEQLNGTDEVLDMFEGKNDTLSINFRSISNSNEFEKSIRSKCEHCFPIIIDECQEIMKSPSNFPSGLSLYRALLKVLYEIRKLPLVIVFVRMKPSIEYFKLIPVRSVSDRTYGDDDINGFKVPFYALTQNTDVMLTESFSFRHEKILSEPCVFGGTSIISSKEFQNFSIRCGRPFWTCFESSFNELFDLAEQKLVANESLYLLECLIMRTGSSVVPCVDLAQKLVVSGMATLLHADAENSSYWIEYVPEPILSNVARKILLSIRHYVRAINEYTKRFKLGMFNDIASPGELVSRIILLRSMDLALMRVSDKMISDKNVNAEIKSTNLLFETDEESDIKSNFERTCSKIADASPFGNTTTKSECNLNSFYSPKLGITTLREFLMMLSKKESKDLNHFGVSDAVLNGLISFNQFIHIDNLLMINQAYLMHGFARSVGFILPPRSPGIDLIIPVLRSDNCMSCLVIKTINYAASEFPADVERVDKELTADHLNFLDFGKIGEFETAPWDDFVRIVIQFRLKTDHFEKETEIFSCWEPIEGSKSFNDSVNCCHSLWILGLNFFKESLFFDQEEIINDLNSILSGDHDYLSAVFYPKVLLPTPLQTSAVGARFLANSARPLANYQNITIEDQSLRSKTKNIYENYQKVMEELEIPKTSKEFKSRFQITTVEDFDDKVVETISVNNKTDYATEFKKGMLKKTNLENCAYSKLSEQEPKYQTYNELHKNLNDFKDEFYTEQMEKRNLTFIEYKHANNYDEIMNSSADEEEITRNVKAKHEQ